MSARSEQEALVQAAAGDHTIARQRARESGLREGSEEVFHAGDIISITSGRLVSPRHIDGVYDLCGWLEQRPVWTHELPALSRKWWPELVTQFAALAAIEIPDDLDGWPAVHLFLRRVDAQTGSWPWVTRPAVSA